MKRLVLFLLCSFCFRYMYTQTDFNALTDKGFQELSEGDPLTARHTLEQALHVMPKKITPESKADFFNNLGVAYYQTGAYKQGIDAYVVALNVYKKLKNDSLVSGSLLNLGLAYKEIGAFKPAVSVLTQAARLSERYGNLQELSAAWNAIGNIQRETGNYEKALDYLQRALRIRESIGYDKGTADSYHNIGIMYLEWKRYDEAGKCLHKALELKQKLNNQSNIMNTLSALGRLYVAIHEPEKAKMYLSKAYEMRKESGNSTKLLTSLYFMGTYYASAGERAKALELFRQTEAIARESQNFQLLTEALMSEINLLKKSGEQELLLRKYQELVEMRERRAMDENRKEIARLEIEYDVERKERELEIRRKQSKLDKIRIENEGLRNQQLIAWVIGLSLFATMVLVMFYQIRRRKRFIELQNSELQEQRDEITHLHQELSHRTKNYFGLLGGILKSDRSQVRHPEATRVLEENIRRLEAMSLIQKYLLDDSANQHKEVKLDTYFKHVIDLVVLNLFSSVGDLKLVCEIEPLYLDYDKAMRLAIALNELICNAIEHGLVQVAHPELRIRVQQTEKKLVVEVRDNGPGIPADQSPKDSKGQYLIVKLLHQMNGVVRYHNDNGCVATVEVDI